MLDDLFDSPNIHLVEMLSNVVGQQVKTPPGQAPILAH